MLVLTIFFTYSVTGLDADRLYLDFTGYENRLQDRIVQLEILLLILPLYQYGFRQKPNRLQRQMRKTYRIRQLGMIGKLNKVHADKKRRMGFSRDRPLAPIAKRQHLV